MAGKGNAASWTSCSHGAGRRYSRTKAKKLFTADDLAEQMTGKVWLSGRAGALVDEIPSAYKDIDQVMADQADLVEVLPHPAPGPQLQGHLTGTRAPTGPEV